MADFTQEEKISRQQAAERLVDIAYALTTGGTLELGSTGRRVSIPVAERVLLKRESDSNGDHVRIAVELSWPT